MVQRRHRARGCRAGVLSASCSRQPGPQAPHLCDRAAQAGAGVAQRPPPSRGRPGGWRPWAPCSVASTICPHLTRVFCSALVPSVTSKRNILTSAQFPELIIFLFFPFWRLTACERERDRQTEGEGEGRDFLLFLALS